MKTTGNWQGIASRLACFVAPLVYFACLLEPVRNRYVDLLMIGSLLTALLGWIIRARKKRLICFSMVAWVLLPVVLLVLPARVPENPQTMAILYGRSLERYTGTAYWWGGETRLGIDCSGLVRAAMMDACVQRGLMTFDGGLLRHALGLWWHDESAEALGEGYRGLTSSIDTVRSLNDLDASKIHIGDLAVAGDGVHVLAYLGSNRWIQADPAAGRVIIETLPSKNPWMIGRVKIVRWTLLATAR